MKKILFLFFVMALAVGSAVYAQSQAKDKSSDAKETKPPAPTAFWAKELPKVTSKTEKRYDINRDEILQTSETKIFLRDVLAEVSAKNSFNVSDSVLLKAYDKNKDGIISKLEIDEIKKDTSY